MTKVTDNQQDTTHQEGAQTDPQTETQTTEQEQSTDNMAENSDTETPAEQPEQTDWQDKYLRLSAEFDNYRKRTLKEKMDLVASGGRDVMLLMLETADDFDRALGHIADQEAKAGVELIYNKFLAALAGKGVVAMDLIGKPFDVDNAEAIAKMPAPAPEQSGQVMDVAQKGYMLGDQVLRFAKVVVYE